MTAVSLVRKKKFFQKQTRSREQNITQHKFEAGLPISLGLFKRDFNKSQSYPGASESVIFYWKQIVNNKFTIFDELLINTFL